jgi:hypothetical protein
MRILLAGLIAVSALVTVATAPLPASAMENCYFVRGTADARNPQISRQRAENRLHRHIADELRSAHGKTVGPTSTHCIRNACEAKAIVCQH